MPCRHRGKREAKNGQLHETEAPRLDPLEPKPRPLRSGHTLNARGIAKWLLSMAL
jgi:hypothetical protein